MVAAPVLISELDGVRLRLPREERALRLLPALLILRRCVVDATEGGDGWGELRSAESSVLLAVILLRRADIAPFIPLVDPRLLRKDALR